MRVYYLKANNTLGFHDIVRVWNATTGREYPWDTKPERMPEDQSYIEVDAMANRDLCNRMLKRWMTPKTKAMDFLADLPPIYVNNDANLCYEDGTLVDITVDPDKEIVDNFPDEYIAYLEEKNSENPPEVTISSFQEDLDHFKDVVRAIINRNILSEDKG